MQMFYIDLLSFLQFFAYFDLKPNRFQLLIFSWHQLDNGNNLDVLDASQLDKKSFYMNHVKKNKCHD